MIKELMEAVVTKRKQETNRCCSQRLLMGDHGMIIEELMVIEQRKGNSKVLGGDHQVIIGGAKCAVRGEWETDHPGLT